MRIVTLEMENRLAQAYVGTRQFVDVLSVKIEQDMYIGQGYAVPYTHFAETAEMVLAEATAIKSILQTGLCKDRHQLQQLLPPGGARQAIDVALWDLCCQFSTQLFWSEAGLKPRKALCFVDLEELNRKDTLIRVESANTTTCRVRIDSDEAAEQFRELYISCPAKQWIISVSEEVNFSIVRRLLTAISLRSLVALELPAQRWHERAALKRQFAGIAFGVIDDDTTSFDSWRWGPDCQYLTLNLATSGGLTHIVECIKEARLRGVGTILCHTGYSMVNPHAMDVLFSLSDWVSLTLETHGEVLGLSEERSAPLPQFVS